MNLTLSVVVLLLLAAPLRALELVVLTSPSPLVEVKVMFKSAGSAYDEPGREGLASVTAEALIQGGFTYKGKLVTKDDLADLTRAWGSAATPSVSVGKETAVFSFRVPREVFARYAEEVIAPMFGAPRFEAKEVERLRAESLQALRSDLRLEEIEALGLVALDNALHHGTSYAHPDFGTVQGLTALQRPDIEGFYRARYGLDNAVVGLSSADKTLIEALEKAISSLPMKSAAAMPPNAPPAVKGRSVLIVALPNAISTGLHAGFPMPVTRSHPDYWPLYLGNLWLGTHRDDFSHLFQVIREERGYNYGDYSYIEHFEDRSSHLFPPYNNPRQHQYFSMWIRPVAHQYAAHVARAMTWELESFIRVGLTEEQCALAKSKARVLYLSLAETGEDLLASAVDDTFHGLRPGYLPSYLKAIESTSCDNVNAAIRKHLQAKDLKYLIVTHAAEASKIAAALASDGPVWGKGPADYQLDSKEENGVKVYQVPEPRLEIMRRDAAWANASLGVRKEDIRIVPVEKVFETATLP